MLNHVVVINIVKIDPVLTVEEMLLQIGNRCLFLGDNRLFQVQKLPGHKPWQAGIGVLLQPDG